MNLITFDNILKDPKDYVADIYKYGFQDVADGDNVFRNIQPLIFLKRNERRH